MCLSEKVEVLCRIKKETILSYIIYEWIVPLNIYFFYDDALSIRCGILSTVPASAVPCRPAWYFR